jgi:acyl-[acyl-carrier-protein]-phospholipid O-acyltransferase/long-chain-fatty-acid--[acyl-carrier-protein] ligase
MNPIAKAMHPPRHGGFAALLATMTCGAVNDNLLRGALLLSVVDGGMWGGALGQGGTGWITVMLYLPFILLLGVTGQLADRYSKRTIIVWTRAVEIGLAVGVTAGFWLQDLWLVCGFFILLAAQSAFFSPAKYGSVPELVPDDRLSRANGLLSLMTNGAIILGVAAAGAMLEIGPVVLGLTMIGVAILSLGSSLLIPKSPPADPGLTVSVRTFTAHIHAVKRMRGTPLLTVSLAWCWFYAVGSIVIMIVPLWRGPLNLTDSAAGALLAAPGVGIGIGGLIAGFASGSGIRAAYVPLGACGMTITFVLLGLVSDTWWEVFVLLGAMGVFAGLYLVPILAMLQHMPVPTFRARTIGTANFLTYLAMAASAVAFGLAAPAVGDDPETWFLICAGGMLLISIGSILQRRILARAASPEAFGTIGGL